MIIDSLLTSRSESDAQLFLDINSLQIKQITLSDLLETLELDIKPQYDDSETLQILVDELGIDFLSTLNKSNFEPVRFESSLKTESTVPNLSLNTLTTNPEFQIIGTKIYDPYGREFISKGVNMFAWEGISNVNNYLNTWGFNTIRVPNYLLGSYNQPHPSTNNYGTNHQIVDAFTSQGAVVIFDAHDRIGGYYEGNDLQTLKDYWQDMAQEFGDNPYVWFDLHNEPGNGTANSQQWVDYHRQLIDIIRAEGANNIIVVEGETWGQDALTLDIPNHADQIMAGNDNILFSIHAYDRWNNGGIGNYFDSVLNQDIPIIIGEYGSVNVGQSTLAASTSAIAAAQQREIGRIAWNAKGDDPNDLTTSTGGHAEYFNGTNTSILTGLGNLVWNDLQRTENLEVLPGYTGSSNSTFSTGTFEVNSSGQVKFNFLFDGGWFRGELAIFNLNGMEAYQPGSLAFIQQAAQRALTNSTQGHIVMKDVLEGGRFASQLPWENNFNAGSYLGVKTFNMNPGDRFGLMLIQHTTVQEIANDPSKIWQWGKLPIFSIPEANPGGVSQGQVVAVDNYGSFAFEDVRIDWGQSDKDYNDVVFQLQGANAIIPSINSLINPQRDWRNTSIGQQLLAYSASSANGNLSLLRQSLDSEIIDNRQGNESVISGNRKNNLLQGEKINDWIEGNQGNDSLFGGLGNDILSGQDDRDLLFGEEGDDVLIGGKGKDLLQAGKGSDLFVLAKNQGIDTIVDFERGVDLIQLAGNLTFKDLIISQGTDEYKGDLLISFAKDKLIAVLADVNFDTLGAINFID